MTAHRKDPFRRVVKADLQDDELGRFWCLELECGHEDVRRVVYRGNVGLTWGGRRKDGPLRSLKDAAPAPNKIRCIQCG